MFKIRSFLVLIFLFFAPLFPQTIRVIIFNNRKDTICVKINTQFSDIYEVMDIAPNKMEIFDLDKKLMDENLYVSYYKKWQTFNILKQMALGFQYDHSVNISYIFENYNSQTDGTQKIEELEKTVSSQKILDHSPKILLSIGEHLNAEISVNKKFKQADIPNLINEIASDQKSLTRLNNLVDEALKTLKKPEPIKKYPFAKAVIIQPDSEIVVSGDIHGDKEVTKNIFEDLVKNGIIKKDLSLRGNHHIVFLGDYIDRKTDGIYVLNFILSLYLKNKDRVHILRGNHEHKSALKKRSSGFYKELLWHATNEKVKANFDGISKLFDSLPQNLFIGMQHKKDLPYNFIYFAHGAPAGFSKFDIADFKPLLNDVISKTQQSFMYLNKFPNTNWANWGDIVSNLPNEYSKIFKITDGLYPSTRTDRKDDQKFRTLDKKFVNWFLEKNSSDPKKFKTIAFVCGHTHAPGGVVQLREKINSSIVDAKQIKYLEQSTDWSKKVFLLEDARARSWIPLVPDKVYSIKQNKVYSCLSSPFLAKNRYNYAAYAIITASKNWTIVNKSVK